MNDSPQRHVQIIAPDTTGVARASGWIGLLLVGGFLAVLVLGALLVFGYGSEPQTPPPPMETRQDAQPTSPPQPAEQEVREPKTSPEGDVGQRPQVPPIEEVGPDPKPASEPQTKREAEPQAEHEAEPSAPQAPPFERPKSQPQSMLPDDEPMEAKGDEDKDVENAITPSPLEAPDDAGTEDENKDAPADDASTLNNTETPQGPWRRGALTTLPSVMPPTPWLPLDKVTVLSRIGVGSCLSQRHPQDIWADVLALAPRPDLFLMIGDNVYGDIKSDDYRELIDAYRVQGRRSEFAKARAAFPFLATWDDHDYGANDAGAEFPHKAAAAKLFADYWQITTGRSPEEGIYYAQRIGPVGKQVHIIMLDTRFFRSSFTKAKHKLPYWGRYQPDKAPDRTMLGARQWAWLKKELEQPADLRLIVSSIQVLSQEHGFERWGNLPRERQRLLDMIARTKKTPTVILSGDRHMGAFYEMQLSANRRLLELTASSLNRSYGPSKDIRGALRVSDLYHHENFGLIDIDWARAQAELSLRGLHGEVFHTLEFALHPRPEAAAGSTSDAR